MWYIIVLKTFAANVLITTPLGIGVSQAILKYSTWWRKYISAKDNMLKILT